MVKAYSSEGIVLASRKYSEADKIIVIYSRNLGKKIYMAKGVRRPKSKKRGGLEVFTEVRFSASRGKGLDILTEVDVINAHTKVRNNLKKTSLAYFYIECVGRLSGEGEKSEVVYNILKDSLKTTEARTDLKLQRKQFTTDLLIAYGYWDRNKKLDDPDKLLQEVVERNINSMRVGKKLLS